MAGFGVGGKRPERALPEGRSERIASNEESLDVLGGGDGKNTAAKSLSAAALRTWTMRPKALPPRLQFAALGDTGRIVWVHEGADPHGFGRKLAKQLEPVVNVSGMLTR